MAAFRISFVLSVFSAIGEIGRITQPRRPAILTDEFGGDVYEVGLGSKIL